MEELFDSWLAMMPPAARFAAPKLPPEPPRPISKRENSRLFYEHKQPLWMPQSVDCRMTIPSVVCERPALNRGGKDWFGVDWTFVESINAPCETPGFKLFDDVTEWKKYVQFPDLEAIDWEKSAESINPTFDKECQIACVLFEGIFERLVSMMGFEDALVSLLIEPESCLELFNALADFKIALIDKLLTWYPLDRIVYHDDWGMQQNTFFSTETFELLLLEPTRRIVEYTHSRGAYFTLHCCGKVESLVPYMVDMGVDSWESAQMAINDLPAIKKKYGDRIGIETIFVNPVITEPSSSVDEVRDFVARTCRELGDGGGLSIMRLNNCAENHLWTVYSEFYRVSQELYGLRTI